VLFAIGPGERRPIGLGGCGLIPQAPCGINAPAVWWDFPRQPRASENGPDRAELGRQKKRTKFEFKKKKMSMGRNPPEISTHRRKSRPIDKFGKRPPNFKSKKHQKELVL
jgi:hypothetical protein